MEQYQTGCNTSDLQSEAEQECGPPDKRQRRPVAKDIPLTVYPFLQLQAVDSLLLNLEKIVQHLTMGQDCITLHPH
ncbi:unnamed protein product [Boreogadus saida]